MCGRYEFIPSADTEVLLQIRDFINSKYPPRGITVKTGEIFPTDTVPVLAKKDGITEAFLMSWGFPKWDGKGVVINGKSETASHKKMFAASLDRRRCVVPASGFFEWQKKDTSLPRDKFHFTASGSAVLYMAGLYSLFEEEGQKKASFVILTKEANSSINDIHDRMPVILSKAEIEPWLTDSSFISQVFKKDVPLTRRPQADPKDNDQQLSLFF